MTILEQAVKIMLHDTKYIKKEEGRKEKCTILMKLLTGSIPIP